MKDILACPFCHGSLLFEENQAQCSACGRIFSYNNGVFYVSIATHVESERDAWSSIKNFFKSYPRLYNFLVNLVSPVYFDRTLVKQLEQYAYRKTHAVLVNLGSGPQHYPGFINVDVYPYRGVHVVGDIVQLPFKNNSVDFVLVHAVLEHVPLDYKVADEIYRVLKVGGSVLCYYPFIQGFHASPHDYTRHTDVGLKVLFSKFKILALNPYGGPTSGLLWILQEWTAILLSLGNRYFYTVVLIIVMGLTFPLKFLDILLLKHPFAKQIASGFYIVAEKYE